MAQHHGLHQCQAQTDPGDGGVAVVVQPLVGGEQAALLLGRDAKAARIEFAGDRAAVLAYLRERRL